MHAKKDPYFISPNLGAPFDAAQDMLYAFAGDTFFPTSSSSQNFKYLWLDLSSRLKIQT